MIITILLNYITIECSYYSIMTEHQKSILSHLTLDTSIATQNPLIPPIHAGELSYPIYKLSRVQRRCGQPLPFGSTSSRIVLPLEPSSSCQVLGYAAVYGKSQQSQIVSFKAPFGTTQSRFISKNKGVPGPASYNTSADTKSKPSCNLNLPQIVKEIDKDVGVGPGSYILDQNGNKKEQLRLKVKQKLKENKQKYFKKRSKQENSSLITINNINTKQRNRISEGTDRIKMAIKQDRIEFNRFLLKDSAQKYMQQPYCPPPTSPFQSSCSINKSFSPVFIQKNDNPYHSYIPITCSPGPAWYLGRKIPVLTGNAASSSFNSKVKRQVFGKQEPIIKEKIKLSYLL